MKVLCVVLFLIFLSLEIYRYYIIKNKRDNKIMPKKIDYYLKGNHNKITIIIAIFILVYILGIIVFPKYMAEIFLIILFTVLILINCIKIDNYYIYVKQYLKKLPKKASIGFILETLSGEEERNYIKNSGKTYIFYSEKLKKKVLKKDIDTLNLYKDNYEYIRRENSYDIIPELLNLESSRYIDIEISKDIIDIIDLGKNTSALKDSEKIVYNWATKEVENKFPYKDWYYRVLQDVRKYADEDLKKITPPKIPIGLKIFLGVTIIIIMFLIAINLISNYTTYTTFSEGIDRIYNIIYNLFGIIVILCAAILYDSYTSPIYKEIVTEKDLNEDSLIVKCNKYKNYLNSEYIAKETLSKYEAEKIYASDLAFEIFGRSNLNHSPRNRGIKEEYFREFINKEFALREVLKDKVDENKVCRIYKINIEIEKDV